MDRHKHFKNNLERSIRRAKNCIEDGLKKKAEYQKKSLILQEKINNIPEYTERVEMHLSEISEIQSSTPLVVEDLKLAKKSLERTALEFYNCLSDIN